MHIDQQPSNDDLQAAYQLLRKPDWPAYADIMAAARHYQVIRGAALRLARGERIERPSDVLQNILAAPPVHSPHVPPTHAAHRRTRSRGLQHDPKRLASNDRDE